MAATAPGAELSTFIQEHHYEVVKQLSDGTNTFGEVFLIKDHLGVLFALKKIRKDDFNKGDFQIASSLKHAFIVRTFTMQEIDPFVFVVSEFIEDGDLKHYIKSQIEMNEKPNPIIAKVLITQILTAIQYTHYGGGKKIIHRDLKSANILLLGKPRPDVVGGGVTVKICDFGLARELSSTVAHTFAGTPVYMAPEIIMSGDGRPKYDERADNWSIGVLLYELATFRLPFPSLSAIMGSIHKPITRPPEMSGSAWDLLWRVLAGLMEVQAAKRLSCTQALDILCGRTITPVGYPNLAEGIALQWGASGVVSSNGWIYAEACSNTAVSTILTPKLIVNDVQFIIACCGTRQHGSVFVPVMAGDRYSSREGDTYVLRYFPAKEGISVGYPKFEKGMRLQWGMSGEFCSSGWIYAEACSNTAVSTILTPKLIVNGVQFIIACCGTRQHGSIFIPVMAGDKYSSREGDTNVLIFFPN